MNNIHICAGLVGGIAPHKTTDDLVGGLCDRCQDQIVAARGWSSASPVLHNEAKGRGSGISLPGSTIFKSPRVPGSAKKAEGKPT